ncbi:hypothetical protein A5725_16960 [Mycobacterium kubicae]|uniref:Rv3235 family protein n=1 Tax=Mycobacterium kubicae TaxID=120959 RepID=UPI0007FB772E|nr:Rv3235 family protein [Mycobacterium kubicae]OBF20103.1 hypothetical protein A5725_16960 [Mycobacterium kubicae]
MSVSPIVSHRDTFAVRPVVDYEPPTSSVPRCRQSALRPSPRVPHRPPGDGGAGPVAAPSPTTSLPMRHAGTFADAALRRVLEVIDRRRPAAQLGSLLTPALLDSVVSVSRALGPPQGAAVLRRMRLQPVVAQPLAAEVFGTYSRGQRIHAIACRVEQVTVGDAARWLVVALHIG